MGNKKIFTITIIILLSLVLSCCCNCNDKDIVDLNNSSREQLQTIYGIGEERSWDIMLNRPYSSLDDCVEKCNLPKNIFKDKKNVKIEKEKMVMKIE